MKNSKKLFLFAVLALVANITVAQTADEIVENYFKATGGKDKWAAMKSVKTSGKVKTQGMEFPLTIMSKLPNNQKMMFSLQGKELVQSSFNGTEAWGTNMMTQKPEKMEAEDSEIMKQEVNFPDAFWNYKEKGYSVALEGEETIEGVACHKIKLTKKPVKIAGKEEENFSYYFFDKENGVPIMMRSVGKKGQMKGIAIESFMSDYKEVNGVFMPFTLTQKMNGQAVSTIAIEKVEINADIDDKEFSFPNN